MPCAVIYGPNILSIDIKIFCRGKRILAKRILANGGNNINR